MLIIFQQSYNFSLNTSIVLNIFSNDVELMGNPSHCSIFSGMCLTSYDFCNSITDLQQFINTG